MFCLCFRHLFIHYIFISPAGHFKIAPLPNIEFRNLYFSLAGHFRMMPLPSIKLPNLTNYSMSRIVGGKIATHSVPLLGFEINRSAHMITCSICVYMLRVYT